MFETFDILHSSTWQSSTLVRSYCPTISRYNISDHFKNKAEDKFKIKDADTVDCGSLSTIPTYKGGKLSLED